MSLDHEAIYKAYPDAVTINDDTGAFSSTVPPPESAVNLIELMVLD